MNRPHPVVSVVVVDYKKDNPLLIECLDGLRRQTYRNFEVILLTDYPPEHKFPGVRSKSYGRYIGPAIKRDDGVKMARGKFVAFIDDDAYPARDWLAQLVRTFVNPGVAAVGGPGVTPPGSSWREKLSGWFSASPVGGGPFTYRFLPGRRMEVDDYPSMNLAVRKSDFMAAGGFDSNFWPGEDTKLCLDLAHKLKKRIIYNPKVVVYHHRRPLFIKHFRQNGNFGIHRGYFARILPQTSFRPEYFGPSIVFVGVVYLAFYVGFGEAIGLDRIGLLRATFEIGLVASSIYLSAMILNGVWIAKMSGNVGYGLLAVPVTVVTHLWYGLRFIQGFCSSRRVENSNQEG